VEKLKMNDPSKEEELFESLLKLIKENSCKLEKLSTLTERHSKQLDDHRIKLVDLYPVDLCFAGSITLFKVNNVK